LTAPDPQGRCFLVRRAAGALHRPPSLEGAERG
jgi:hypothetical protein